METKHMTKHIFSRFDVGTDNNESYPKILQMYYTKCPVYPSFLNRLVGTNKVF